MDSTRLNNICKGLAELKVSVNKCAQEHGFWEEDREDGTCIALMHSELSEALEEIRGEGAAMKLEEMEIEELLTELKQNHWFKADDEKLDKIEQQILTRFAELNDKLLDTTRNLALATATISRQDNQIAQLEKALGEAKGTIIYLNTKPK